ncbi:MAG: hypothetical protein MRK01_05120 [Candidatus Scalindua sp.]|nr:hypothetical protein [Candidatus Scalindua sp.]
MYSLPEKRKYARIELENRKYKEIETPCIARFHTRQSKDNDNRSPEWDIVAVKNLSAGGMVFTYYKDLGIDSILHVKFGITQSMPHISCVGRIVRIEERQHLSGYCTAIEFIEISAESKEELKVTIEEILSRKSKKKNFSFYKFVKMVNFMKRRDVAAEPLQENTSGLQQEDLAEMKVCCSCNKSISTRDTATGSAREHYGKLFCQGCSGILSKKEDREKTIKNIEMRNTHSETMSERDAGTNGIAQDVVIGDEHTEMVSSCSERITDRAEEGYDQAGLFSQKEMLRRVTFRLPRFAASKAMSVYIVGDFNNWNSHCNPMKKERNGDHTLSLDLVPGNNYKFGYLIDSVLVGLSSCSIKREDAVEENAAVCLQS